MSNRVHTQAWRGQIRIPMPLATWLKTKSEKNFRSMNQEIVEMVRRFKETDESQKGVQQ